MAVLTEEKLYEAFGLEKPEAEPSQQDQQEPAAPDQESTAEQGAETEVGTETASDADSENDNADTEAQPESNTDTGADTEKLTPEQLIGFLAHAAGLTDRPEAVSAKELSKDFSWDKVRKEDVYISADIL